MSLPSHEPPQPPKRTGALLGIALTLGVLGWLAWQGTRSEASPPRALADGTASRPQAEPDLRAEVATYRGAAPLPFRTDRASDRPLHTKSKYPPGTRLPVRITERPKEGIPCGDGTFLPFLNGMTAAPKLNRDPAYGPVPPIVAIVVDADGIEWWEHADGSTTTCHYHGVTAHGKSYFDPVTRHGVPKPNSQVLGAELGK